MRENVYRKLYPLLLLVVCIVLFSCGGKCSEEKKKAGSEKAVEQRQPRQVPFISIYCYGSISDVKSNMLAGKLKKYYPRVDMVRRHLVLPKEYYHQGRNRYDGSGLLKDLGRLRKGDVVLGVTDEVIYKANEISPTYGIFGVSPVGAHVALISLTQPSGRKHTDDHLVKLALHELGHAFGLNHCTNEHCFMVDAEHGNKFSQTPSFCKDCKQFLNKNGWEL